MILLALLAATTYGAADFVGGLVSQRASPWAVAWSAQVAGAALVVVVALPTSGRPDGTDLAWALLAGVANGIGTAFLYRGLSAGRMGVVAPVSGVGAALVPVVVGIATGDRPALLAWLGIAVALLGIWLVSREPAAGATSSRGLPPGLLDGVFAGVGFGVIFTALAQIPRSAGLLPLAVNQAVAGVTIMAIAAAVGRPWLPRERRARLGAVGGVLGAIATGSFMIATRGGELSLVAVITSLYPAATVILAAAVLHERIRASQAVGLVMCATTVAAVALG